MPLPMLGTVAALWRWPVKSMGGERVRALRVDGRGAGGDRTHAVFTSTRARDKPLTAREAPRLLAWRAAYPFNRDGGLDPRDPPHAIVVGARRSSLPCGATRGCGRRSRTTSAAPSSCIATSTASRTSSAPCS